MSRKLKIAFVGLKGIPAKWGGIEVYVQEVARRLVEKGHEVTVYGASWYCGQHETDQYMGIKIKKVATISNNAAEALVAGLLSSLHALFIRYDVVHFHGFASYFYVPLLRAFGKKTVVTTHGYDSGWSNPKYNKFAAFVIKNAHDMGVRYADRVTTVARYIKQILEEDFGRSVGVLRGGIDQASLVSPNIISKKYGLQPYSFLLFMGRLDRIKRIEWLIKTFRNVGDKGLKLVIAGGAVSANDPYVLELGRIAEGDQNIIFTGFVWGEQKEELLSNCRFFVLPSINEGVPIALIEAMNHQRLCLASNIPANTEIIKDGVNGFLFEKHSFGDMSNKFETLSRLSVDEIMVYGKTAAESLRGEFDWDKTAEQTEIIYLDLNNA